MTDLERWAPTGIDTVDRAVATWRPANLVPQQFKDKDGHVQIADLALAAHWLHALDVDPVPNLPQVYVIKGRVGIMAELQRALLARAGWDLEIVETTNQRATVRIRPAPAGNWKPDVTVTMADAEKAGWTKESGGYSNYKLIPDRMLIARACTKAISLYAPGVLHGITAATATIAQLIEDDTVEADAPPVRMVPPRSVAPSGATIPEHLREPAIDDNVRRYLLFQVENLTENQRDRLGAIVHPMLMPNLKSSRFTVAHGALLERLLAEIIQTSGPALGAPTPPRETPAGPDPIPDHVYDDTPESRGYDEDLQPASYADPTQEPF